MRVSRWTPERLPSYGPLRESYSTGFQYRRKCARCDTHKPMTGGKTFPGGKVWHCSDCRGTDGRNQDRAGAVPPATA